jgi:hypothetical protein
VPETPDDSDNVFDESAAPALESPAQADPEPAIEVPAADPLPPADTSEPDLFGDAPAADAAPASESADPFEFDTVMPEEPAPAPETAPAEPAVPEPFEPADSTPVDPSQPVEVADPFADPFAEEEPTDETPAPAEDFVTQTEPARRWIHANGGHALVATLVDVVDDGTCVLETSGQRLRVPLENLSGHDRDYVGGAAMRIAARRDAKDRAIKAQAVATPAPTDTAGM